MLVSTLTAIAMLAAAAPEAPAAGNQFDLSCKLKWMDGTEKPFRYAVDLGKGESCNIGKCAPLKLTVTPAELVLERRVSEYAGPPKVVSKNETTFDRKSKTLTIAHGLVRGGKVEKQTTLGSGPCQEAPFTGFNPQQR